MPKDKPWKVTIETRGQCGFVHYTEGSQSVRFDWEYGGHDIIGLVWGPEPAYWDSKYPWAIGRRKEIMRRIAAEVIKQRAPSCWAKLDFDRTYITIRKNEIARIHTK